MGCLAFQNEVCIGGGKEHVKWLLVLLFNHNQLNIPINKNPLKLPLKKICLYPPIAILNHINLQDLKAIVLKFNTNNIK